MSQYNLIFQGSIADGYRMDQVKRNLANLLKADQKKVDYFFDGLGVFWIGKGIYRMVR